MAIHKNTYDNTIDTFALFFVLRIYHNVLGASSAKTTYLAKVEKEANEIFGDAKQVDEFVSLQKKKVNDTGFLEQVGGEKSTALRQVGNYLESVEDVFSNPKLLKGKSPLQVKGILSKTPDWKVEKLGKGAHKGQGLILREYGAKGPTGRMIQWHPGGGHHGSNSYWKVSSEKGTFRIF